MSTYIHTPSLYDANLYTYYIGFDLISTGMVGRPGRNRLGFYFYLSAHGWYQNPLLTLSKDAILEMNTKIMSIDFDAFF